MAYTVSYDGIAIDLKCIGGYVYVVARIIAHLAGSDRIGGEHLKDHTLIDVIADFDVHIIPGFGGDDCAFSR